MSDQYRPRLQASSINNNINNNNNNDNIIHDIIYSDDNSTIKDKNNSNKSKGYYGIGTYGDGQGYV